MNDEQTHSRHNGENDAGRRVIEIPDHELLRRIGSGSYGEVWLARSVIGQYRAVKIVMESRFEDRRPFEREFNGIRQYEPISRAHPGLVNILHVGRNDEEGYFFYVMEPGDDIHTGRRFDPDAYKPRTLRYDLCTRGRLPTDECLQISTRLADALGHLHGEGLVHRDIKPSNVIFVGGAPKLADIGLVAGTDLVQNLVGTEGYTPPEGNGTARADIYALGKVIYEITTGNDRMDWPEAPDDVDVLPKRDRWLRLNTVMLRACDSRGDHGYVSARAMREDLQRISAGRPPRRLWTRMLSDYRVILALTGLLLVVFSVGFYLRTSSRSNIPDDNRNQELGREHDQKIPEDLPVPPPEDPVGPAIEHLYSLPGGFRDVVAADVTGDTAPELILADGSGAAIYNAEGQRIALLPGVGNVRFAGDLNGDGRAEIFATRRTDDGLAQLSAHTIDGEHFRTFSIRGGAEDTNLSPLLIDDLSADGRLELVAGISSGYSRGPRGIIVFDAQTGRARGHTEIAPAVAGPPWAGPVFGRGPRCIFIGSRGVANGRELPDGSNDYSSYLWKLDANGEVVWRRGPFHTGGFFNCDLAVPDIRSDKRRFVAVSLREHGMNEWDGRVGIVKLLRIYDGEPLPGAERDFKAPVRVVEAKDFGAGQEISLLVVHEDWQEEEYYLRVLRLASGLPDIDVFNIGEEKPRNVTAIDLDGSGVVEVIFTVGHVLHILDNELRPVASWEHPGGAPARLRRMVISDLTGDGMRELIVSTGKDRSDARIEVLKPVDLQE